MYLCMGGFCAQKKQSSTKRTMETLREVKAGQKSVCARACVLGIQSAQ